MKLVYPGATCSDIASPEVSPLREARINHGAATVDTADGGSRNSVLHPPAAETAIGADEAEA